MPRNVSGFRLFTERLLLFAGLAAIAVAAWFLVGSDLWRRWEDHKFDEQIAQTRSEQVQTSESPKAATSPSSGDVVGRLSIARLNVKSIVREGASDGVLSLALGHIKGTAMPGDPGNVGIAGHRDTLFRGLRNVSKDDQIVFETTDRKYVYQVESTEVVPPSAVEVLQPGLRPELTLVTCYPFEYIGSAPNRFIVKAKLLADRTEAYGKPIHFDAPPLKKALAAARMRPSVKTVADPNPVPRRETPSKIAVANETPRRINFTVTAGHSRELIPGKVWFGVSGVDSSESRLDGWLWMVPARRTIWLRNEDTNEPVTFSNGGDEYALTVTKTAANSVSGYLSPAEGGYKMKPMAYQAAR